MASTLGNRQKKTNTATDFAIEESPFTMRHYD